MSKPGTCTRALTSYLAAARGKVSNHQLCVKLNVVGCDIDDISLCLEMPYLEVLSLSVNRICNLSGLRNCTRLKELYLRENNISNLDELKVLKKAANLTHLGMKGNPCEKAAGTEYRAMVLRLVPQIKHLDEIAVSPEELSAALNQKASAACRPEPPIDKLELNPKLADAMACHRESEYEQGSVSCVSFSFATPPKSEALPPLETQAPAPRNICSSIPPPMSQSSRSVAGQAIYMDNSDASVATDATTHAAGTDELPQSNNVLTAALRLLPEMDNDNLMVLYKNIFNLVSKRAAPN